MIYFIVFLVYFIFQKNKISVPSIISLIISLSGLSAYIIDKDIDFLNYEDYVYSAYTCFILLLLISAIKNIRYVDYSKIKVSNQIVNILHVLGSIAFVVSIYILLTSMEIFASAHGTIDEFKNQGDADRLIKAKVGTFLLTYVRLISPLSYLILPLHFLFILHKRYINSILFLLYSIVLPLTGLFALSRSFLTQFLIIYFLFFTLFNKQLDRKIKKIYSLVVISLLLLIMSINYSIAEERFSDAYFYETRISNASLIKDKTTYSMLDYFSQWVYNNNESLKNYSSEKRLNGAGSLPLLRRFDIIDSDQFFEKRTKSLGIYSTTFNGLVSSFVYEFGFLFSTLIVVIIWFGVKSRFKNKSLDMIDTMFLSLYFAFVGMFFVGNILYYEVYSLAIIYLFLIAKSKILQ